MRFTIVLFIVSLGAACGTEPCIDDPPDADFGEGEGEGEGEGKDEGKGKEPPRQTFHCASRLTVVAV